MSLGYARTSTSEQIAGFQAQEQDLLEAGCQKIFREQVSSVDVKERAQLALARDFIREGDTLIVTKLDRLCRSLSHMNCVLDTLSEKGASLRILNLGIDTGSPTGQLVLNVLGGIAAWEREMMLERQRDGISRAKALGKYKGRAPTAQAKASEVLGLTRAGMGATRVAKQLGMSRASVYNIFKANSTA